MFGSWNVRRLNRGLTDRPRSESHLEHDWAIVCLIQGVRWMWGPFNTEQYQKFAQLSSLLKQQEETKKAVAAI